MKNVLFLSPPFFNYPSVIQGGLLRVFDKVTYFNTTPSSRLYKIGWYLESYLSNHALKRKLHKDLFNNIKKQIEQDDIDYDYIFVIKGSCIPDDFYGYLKSKYPHARYVQYIWDDICNDPHAPETFKFYDSVFSYNEKDCVKYGIKFRPFFFSEEYESNISDRKYDISCIMSFSEDRIIFLNKFFNACSDIKRQFVLIKGSWLLRMLNKSKIGNLGQYISSKGVNYNQMMEILQESKCLVDIQHPKQEGLTTRAFEALATRTKMITTNANIMGYDFYDPQNIAVVSRDNPVVDVLWLKDSYKEVESCVLKKYALSTFISDILNN